MYLFLFKYDLMITILFEVDLLIKAFVNQASINQLFHIFNRAFLLDLKNFKQILYY